LILGFLSVAIWVGVIGHISLFQLNRIAGPLNTDIPESIEVISKTSYLDGLAQFIRYYNEVLTQSARNYAFTRDKKWEKRYRDVEPKLDKIIKEAIDKGEDGNREFFSNVDKANLALVEMEYKSIELVNKRRAKEAIKILESGKYWDQKEIYEQGLRDYVHRRGAKYDEALLSSTRTVDLATKQVQDLIKASRRLVLILAIPALLLAVASGLVISRSIYKPLRELRAATAEIGKGKLNTEIKIESNDEIGQLAASFKKMVDDLKNTTTSIDNLNREITDRKMAEANVRLACKELEITNKELKGMQSQMVQSEKLAAIGQLAAGIAHEVNNPMSFVASNFQTLESYMKKFQELFEIYNELMAEIEACGKTELLNKIGSIKEAWDDMKIDFVLDDIQELFGDSREGLERVTDIIQNLKDFSRVGHPEAVEEYDLNDGIETTLVVVRSEIKYDDADVKTEFSQLPPILCNSGQINQVFLNILVNAAQAIKSQERANRGTITIRTYATETEVVCEISDDGPGIEPDKLPKIFDPFFTTKPTGKGTGLGLSVSYDIIANKHNGKLLVESTVGKGTKFIIKLPINKKQLDHKKEITSDGKENSIICRR